MNQNRIINFFKQILILFNKINRVKTEYFFEFMLICEVNGEYLRLLSFLVFEISIFFKNSLVKENISSHLNTQ